MEESMPSSPVAGGATSCGFSPPISPSLTAPRPNEIASLDIPPRSCRSSQLKSNSIQLPPQSVAAMGTRLNLVTIATNSNNQQPALNGSSTGSELSDANSHVTSSLSSVTLPNATGSYNPSYVTHGGAPNHNFSPGSITINIYRPPVLIGGMNTLMSGSNKKSDSPTCNGGACLSLVRPALQAQECSSDDLRVTVPPIRSEVMLNVSSFNAPVPMSATQVSSPECPRPVQGPVQSEPRSSTDCPRERNNDPSYDKGRPEDSPSSSNKDAHCNIPRVKPRWKSFASTQISAQTPAAINPEPREDSPALLPNHNDSIEKQEINGHPESQINSLSSDKSNSLSSDSSTASNISVICTTSVPKTTVLSPVVDTNKAPSLAAGNGERIPNETVNRVKDSPERKDRTSSGVENTRKESETSDGQPVGAVPVEAISAIDLEGATVKLTPRQAFFIRGPIYPQPLPSATMEGSPNVNNQMSPSPSSSSLVSSASCSSLPQNPSLGKLPPRPPSLKKLSPLQLQLSSSSATTSPTGPTPPSYIGSSRRSLGGVVGGGVGAMGSSGGKSGPNRALPPLQMSMFTRRSSISSQDSSSSCLTPTKPTPPSHLPVGRFPNMSPLSNPGIPPLYHQHTSSPVASPYSDSPSNSRPPSWYGMRYGFFRGRDSSPSATSRDSLDSFIRPPPSGIFSSRNSTGNLLASRSSMDNLSDTSGDSVFDDIMSESEKKSLDDTAESVGSMGSLNIADSDANGCCSSSQGGAVAPPDGATNQGRMPSSGRMSKQASFDMSTVQEVPSGGNGIVTSQSASSIVTPGVTSYGQQSSISQPQSQAQVQIQNVGPEPPPSYEEAIGLVPEGASSSHLLTYKDFVPSQDPQRRSWEPFNKVVLHANEWLILNPDVRIASCESVLGFSAQSDGFNPDRSVGTRSQVVTESTYYLRFLRIWYSRLDQTSTDIEPQQVRYANFISATESSSISTLVELINSKLNCTIKGDILNVETLYILRKAVRCPDTSCWREQPCDTKSYSFFLRMFWLEPQEERQHHISLGFMDIVPQHASGKNFPHDYEPFAVLVQVAQWWARQKADPGTHIINVQSLYVKQKALCTFWQRLHYTESAGGNNSLKYTMYNQILRIYFQTPVSTVGTPISPSIQISYRTFTPVQLTSPTDPCLKFESFGETVNRVLHWLKLSGAQLLSIETIKIRMYGGMQGPHGAECTLLRSEGRKYCDREHWLHCIRVYFVGEYQEPDSSRIPPIPHVVPYFTTSPRPIAFLAPTVAFT